MTQYLLPAEVSEVRLVLAVMDEELLLLMVVTFERVMSGLRVLPLIEALRL